METNVSSIHRIRSLLYCYGDSTRPSRRNLFHNSSSSYWLQSWRRISSMRARSCKLHEFWQPLLWKGYFCHLEEGYLWYYDQRDDIEAQGVIRTMICHCVQSGTAASTISILGGNVFWPLTPRTRMALGSDMSYFATRCHQIVQYCPEVPSEDSNVLDNLGDRCDKEHGNYVFSIEGGTSSVFYRKASSKVWMNSRSGLGQKGSVIPWRDKCIPWHK